jgi:hypothetical protein
MALALREPDIANGNDRSNANVSFHDDGDDGHRLVCGGRRSGRPARTDARTCLAGVTWSWTRARRSSDALVAPTRWNHALESRQRASVFISGGSFRVTHPFVLYFFFQFGTFHSFLQSCITGKTVASRGRRDESTAVASWFPCVRELHS